MIRPWPNVSAAFFDKSASDAEINQFGNIVCLKQIHSGSVIHVTQDFLGSQNKSQPEGDALVTKLNNTPLAVRTADCLPLLAYGKTSVGACHAGWRGLSAGIIENWITNLGDPVEEIQVAIGPSIGICHFEVGNDVREIIFEGTQLESQEFAKCERKHTNPQKTFLNLSGLARLCLSKAGVKSENIQSFDNCTFCDENKYFSYRREGKRSGSLYTVIKR